AGPDQGRRAGHRPGRRQGDEPGRGPRADHRRQRARARPGADGGGPGGRRHHCQPVVHRLPDTHHPRHATDAGGRPRTGRPARTVRAARRRRATGHLVHPGDRGGGAGGDRSRADTHPGPARAPHRDHTMKARLDHTVLAEVDGMLAGADADAARMYPGDQDARQPVHTVYVPAHTYTADAVRSWGAAALAALADHAPGTDELARLLDLPPAVVAASLPLVRDKLAREPIEDLRVDFEDGLGPCSDDDEDALAAAAGAAVRRAVEQGTCPPSIGPRVKVCAAATRARGFRTLALFLGGVRAGGPLPDGFVVTLPKVTTVAQVEAMDRLCERLEDAYALPSGRLRFEVQVETPQVILAADGTATVARIVHAASGRLSGLHYGTYDYSAACGIAAGYQSLEHPVADHARAVMQLAAAGTGVSISDGST